MEIPEVSMFIATEAFVDDHDIGLDALDRVGHGRPSMTIRGCTSIDPYFTAGDLGDPVDVFVKPVAVEKVVPAQLLLDLGERAVGEEGLDLADATVVAVSGLESGSLSTEHAGGRPSRSWPHRTR